MAEHDYALRPWYRRRFTRRQRPLFGIPMLSGFFCAAVAYYTGSIALAVFGFGLMFVAFIVASIVTLRFYREDKERQRRGQLAE